MYLRFHKVDIEGFQSIGKCSVSLESQGIVSIRGVNEYDNKTLSNGSGKSSIMEAICWCIFGKTSNGVANVANKYYEKGCTVTVSFSVDFTLYSITRSISHENKAVALKVLKDDKDISSRNKSSTDALIRDSVFPMSQDIFLSTVFLSQGFSGRLSLLTPSARKERLEVIANLDNAISEFKESISTKNTEVNSKLSELNTKVSVMQGELTAYRSELTKINSICMPETPDVDINSLEDKMAKLDEQISEIQSVYNTKNQSHIKLSSEMYALRQSINALDKQYTNICNQLNSVHVTSECPMCHREMSEELSDEVHKELNAKADEIDAQKQAESEKLDKMSDASSILSESLVSCTQRLEKFKTFKNELNSKISEYNTAIQQVAYAKGLVSHEEEYKEKIANLAKEQEVSAKMREQVSKEHEILDHILKLITKDFRTYVLQDIVKAMNVSLKAYSSQLFQNESEVISVDTDNVKLDIRLGDTLYESLSGGEKKKVDIALVLAQRDLALKLSGTQTNIIILDEILENMDEQASMATLSMLNAVSEELESLFLISHNNYAIPIDSTITVTKHSDRVSTVSQS